MNRKEIEKRIRRVLIILFVAIIVLETAVLAIGTSRNDLELLTMPISFIDAMIIVLMMDIPLFLLVAILTAVTKEACLYSALKKINSNNDKKRFRLSAASAVLAVLTVMLYFTTSNTLSADLNDALFIATLILAAATVIVYIAYIITNKKLG